MNRETTDERLAAKLRELRLAHGYKQSEIADIIEIKQSTYSQYETGKRSPGPIALYKIANFYGLCIDDLLKLSIPLENDIYFDAVRPSARMASEADYLDFARRNEKKSLSPEETELLYYFSKLDITKRKEVIAYAAFRHTWKE